MANKKSQRIEADVVYPGHWLPPEDLLSFIETAPFQRRWRDCGLTDDELFELQLAIMIDPKAHPVVRDTGGLRKMVGQHVTLSVPSVEVVTRKTAAALIRDAGFDPVYGGPLRIARYTEPFGLLVAQLAYEGTEGPELAYRFQRFAAESNLK